MKGKLTRQAVLGPEIPGGAAEGELVVVCGESKLQVDPEPRQHGAEQQGLHHRATPSGAALRGGVVIGSGLEGTGGDGQPAQDQGRDSGDGDQQQRRPPVHRLGHQVGDQRPRQVEERRKGNDQAGEETAPVRLRVRDGGERGGEHRRHPGRLERIAREQELLRTRPAPHEHPQRPHEQATGVGQARPVTVAEEGPRDQEEGADRHLQSGEHQGGCGQALGVRPGGSKTLLGPQHHPPEDPLRQEHDHDPEQDRRDAHALPSIRGCGFPGWWVGAHLGVSSGSAKIPAGPRTVIRRQDASHPGAADRPVVTAFLHPAGSRPRHHQGSAPDARWSSMLRPPAKSPCGWG